MKNLFYLCLLFLSSALLAQTGQVQGKIIGYDTNYEGLPFANVYFEIGGESIGAQSDFDGFYTISNIPEGVYNLKVQYIGYKTSVIENVKIIENEITIVNETLVEENRIIYCYFGSYYVSYKIPLLRDINEGNATVYDFDRFGNVK